MGKKCVTTGKEVNEHLTKLGINTPMIDELVNDVSDDDKINLIRENVSNILTTLGLDLTDDSLQDTPQRVSEMFVREIFSGLKSDTFPKCTTVENKFCHGDEFVLEKNITLYSDCEHHLRPIIGKVHVAYIPKKKVLGLSKLNRICHYFARRPAIQERLNQQIAHTISFITESPHVMVVIEAEHTCVSQRGVEDVNSSTVTATCLGNFGEHDSVLRREVMSNINR